MIWRIFSFIKPQRGLLVASFIGASIAVFFMLLIPVLIGSAIDTFIDPVNINWTDLGKIILTMVISIALVVIFQAEVVITSARLSFATARRLRDACFEKLQHLPLLYLDTHAHGDIVSRIVNDCDTVSDGLYQALQQLMTGALTILGTLLFMFFISPPIALIVVFLSPVSIGVAWAITHASQKSFAAQQALQGSLGAYVQEHIQNQKLISLFSYNDVAIDGFKALNDELYTVGEKAQFASSLSNPGTRFANNIVYAVVAFVGCTAVLTGVPSTLTIGGIQSFLSYTTQYTKPFNDITSVVAQMQTATASATRIFALLDAADETPDAPDALRLPSPIKGEIAFNAVDFSYNPSMPFIENLSFSVGQGERIALVGPTGCGKTTLINLLLRFYDIDEGKITVDGLDTRLVARTSLRKAFGMVLQDTWLFEGSVLENIRYGNLNASDEDVKEAARSAYAESFIQQLPDGYNTVLGPGGGSLSEGQRQLLCIARTMLQNPSILLLDEATSSIDTRTEVLVQDAFDTMIEGRTSLIVAHRLSTIRNATCILVMKDGKIIERGNHDELMRAGGFYRKLYESQWEISEAEEKATS